MPPLNDMEMLVVAAALRDLLPELPAPSKAALRSLEARLVSVLSLGTSDMAYRNAYRSYPAGNQIRDFARLQWRYGDALLSHDHPSEFVTLASGETVRVVRDKKAETLALKTLHGYGLNEMPNVSLTGSYADYSLLGLDSAAAWPEWVQQAVPKLRAAGWQIEMLSGFRHHVLEVEAWLGDFDEQADGWFSLNMGIVVNGERVALAPLLHELFKVDPRWLDAPQLERLPDQEAITLQLPDGGQVKVPALRIKPLARTLLELFDGGGMKGDGIRLSRYDVSRIQQLTDMDRWQFKGADALITLAKQLKNTNGIQAVLPPKNFPLELRPYQLEGLAWLQFLRENQLAGILADDMGLGKTAQALAHLLLEKQSGRMDKPTLVVLPTSLIFNWKREAERFAPDLKLLSLHGKQRADYFAAIPQHDVILTTYPLLWRDEEMLLQHDYHLLILDEAQTVKNAASQAALVVRKLKARHRLCLTGTPLENHLGDLWSQFDFLLPGLLGDAKSFTKIWRTPIEKQGNLLRRNLLAQRVRPFILRRRKQDVASDLPEKTLIVRSVELAGAQRDLYETVRIAMDQRVRQEIADKGFARSHIIILDALLKLRQVCCDPRLLKLTAAQKVQEHAKLDLLMEMLPELVSEGRRILVFSQFTSMLELIEAELHKENLGYVKLTGDTQNREEVVRSFQEGEVPIFLISLKAGGVGLNLTTADTVIHYDPWWNPAVENQATDRAHRLGQVNKVFVYKLVVAGSIEEKILALQEKKAELAAGILSEDSSGLVKFGEADIAALLAPLPSDEAGS
jgi:SNF2 family DNA or RNA helicase